MDNTPSTNSYTQALDKQIVILQECQHSKNVTSCSSCQSFIGCAVREAYVKAVYESMAQGQQGSFDFN